MSRLEARSSVDSSSRSYLDEDRPIRPTDDVSSAARRRKKSSSLATVVNKKSTCTKYSLLFQYTCHQNLLNILFLCSFEKLFLNFVVPGTLYRIRDISMSFFFFQPEGLEVELQEQQLILTGDLQNLDIEKVIGESMQDESIEKQRHALSRRWV